jgi:hypothetical protein
VRRGAFCMSCLLMMLIMRVECVGHKGIEGVRRRVGQWKEVSCFTIVVAWRDRGIVAMLVG